YLPMPHALQHSTLQEYLHLNTPRGGFYGDMPAYLVSLLKAYWGEAAKPSNDFCFDYLPRLTGDHSSYPTVMAQIDGKCKGYFLLGENPAVGHGNAKMQRAGLSNLDWLVVRDFSLIESATWWKDGPEIETGESRTEDIATEVFFFPAAAHTEKSGTFTNTQRLLQWREQAVEPEGECRSETWFMTQLGRRMKARATDRPRDAGLRALTWDYGDDDNDAVLREIHGWSTSGPIKHFGELKNDGTTTCGCWIYSGVYDGENKAHKRDPHGRYGHGWGYAWPLDRRILYNRASAAPD